MDKLLERLEQMEAKISVLKDEKFDNKSQIKILEEKLSMSEKRILELERKSQKPSKKADCCINANEVKTLMRRLSDVEKQEERLQKQSQDASKKLDKLQIAFSGVLQIKHQNDYKDLLGDVKNDVDSLHDKLKDLNAETKRLSSQMEQMSTKCNLVNKELQETTWQIGLETPVDISGQQPLTAAMLAHFPPEEQKQKLGDRLFPPIQRMYPDLARKLTYMLLCLDHAELLDILKSPEELWLKVTEAVAVLEYLQANEKAADTVQGAGSTHK